MTCKCIQFMMSLTTANYLIFSVHYDIYLVITSQQKVMIEFETPPPATLKKNAESSVVLVDKKKHYDIK